MRSKHQTFQFPDPESLLGKASELDLKLPYSEDISPLLTPIDIGDKQSPNRMAIHPMEGCDCEANGAPGELTFRRYKRFAAGGSGLIWFEACAILQEGRSNPRQMMLTPDTLDEVKRLVEETRKAASNGTPLLVLQLTHSGRYSKPKGKKEPIIAQHHPVLDPQQNIDPEQPVITDEELDRLQATFVKAAILAEQAGFDGVDIKACHGYLISELLGGFFRTNSRYGESFENRSRFLLETINQVKASAQSIFVTTRLNAYDSTPNGFGVLDNSPDLSEPKALIQRLDIPVLNLSLGIPYYKPHIGRPFNKAVKGASLPNEHPLVGVARLIDMVGDLQESAPSLPMVGTGYSWLRHHFPHVGAGVLEEGKAALIGVGRSAFAYPDAANDLARYNTLSPKKTCTGCSYCTQIMRDGGKTGCVVHDKEIYFPQYKEGRRKATEQEE